MPECELGNSPKLVLGELDVVNVATLPNIGKECYGYVNRTSGTRVFGQQTKDLRHEYCINLSSCSYKGTNYSKWSICCLYVCLDIVCMYVCMLSVCLSVCCLSVCLSDCMF